LQASVLPLRIVAPAPAFAGSTLRRAQSLAPEKPQSAAAYSPRFRFIACCEGVGRQFLFDALIPFQPKPASRPQSRAKSEPEAKAGLKLQRESRLESRQASKEQS
jgi:hypothetical protein